MAYNIFSVEKNTGKVRTCDMETFNHNLITGEEKLKNLLLTI